MAYQMFWAVVSINLFSGGFVNARSIAEVHGGEDDLQHSYDSIPGRSRRGEDRSPIDWQQRAQQELMKQLNVQHNMNIAKNVIIFIGDGMGFSSVTAGRIFRAQRVTGDRTEDGHLSWEDFPFTGFSKTYGADAITSESSAAANAILCGEKTRAGVLGVNQNVIRGDCASQEGNDLRSILHRAQDTGKWAGIVTNTRATHATPAAGYAHAAERRWESSAPAPCADIASQFIDLSDNQIMKVLMGGGRRNFFPNTSNDNEYGTPGRRIDGRNLVQEWLDQKAAMGLSNKQYHYAENQKDFNKVVPAQTEYLLGLFEPNNMKYESERQAETGSWREPSLTEMTEKAIQILSKNPQGYVLLVEGGRIDHAHHDNNGYNAMLDLSAFQDAVQRAAVMVSEDDTLLVVTADHSATFVLNGYPAIDSDIMGLMTTRDGDTLIAKDGKPYTILSYTDGARGWKYHRSASGNSFEDEQFRKDLTNDPNMGTASFFQDSPIPLFESSHGGEDVPVYARGPMAQLFVGQHEENYLAHAMMYAACIGPNNTACSG